jgi:hypothetical protein
MSSVIRILTTSLAFSVLQEKASIHPVNMSTSTTNSFELGSTDVWVKYTRESPLLLCSQSLEATVTGIYSLAYFTSLHYLLNCVLEP